MPLWKKFWLLVSVIWVVIAALNAATIIAFQEEAGKAWRPIILGIAVPALAYLIGWIWERLRGRR